MKTILFFTFVAAIFIQAEGKALGVSSEEADIAEDVAEEVVNAKERIKSLNQLVHDVDGQLKEQEEFAKKFDIGFASIQLLSGDELERIKDYAESIGLDFDAAMEMLESKGKKLKEKAKKLGFDINALGEEFTKVKRGIQDLDIEVVKEWAEEQYKKLKDKLAEFEKSGGVRGYIEKFERKAKKVVEKFERKAKEAVEKVKEKTKKAFENFWQKLG